MKFLYVSFRRVLTTLVCSSVLLALSCQKEGNALILPNSGTENYDPVYEYILSLGFSKDKIVDEGRYYTAEGDISFEKQSKTDKGARPSHSVFKGMPVVNYTNVGNISVTVGNNFTSTTWRNKIVTATQAAISSWNNISSSSKIHFDYIPSGPATITVNYDPSLDGSADVARGGMPTNCNASPSVRLAALTNDPNEFNAAQLHFLITHELGHSLGFRHTNLGTNGGTDGGGFHVWLTPETENGSVMNSQATWGYTPQGPSFTQGDQTAAAQLYPVTPYVYANWNSGLNNLTLEWPMSRFCSTTVTVEIYKDGIYDYSLPVSNTGRFVDTRIPGPGSYELTVYANNRDDNLSAFTSVVY
jgi:hypothetical protein